MGRWQDDRPRGQHYEFAHKALPGIVRNPAIDFAALADQGRLDAALRTTWTAVGERHPDEEPINAEELRGELVDAGWTKIVLITLPAARHAAEALFIVVGPLSPPESRRYITPEYSWKPLTAQPSTILGGWAADAHVNLGSGPDTPTRFAFLARVSEILGL